MKNRKIGFAVSSFLFLSAGFVLAEQQKSITFPGVSYTDPLALLGLNNDMGVPLDGNLASLNRIANTYVKKTCMKGTFEMLFYNVDDQESGKRYLDNVRRLFEKRGYSTKVVLSDEEKLSFVTKDKQKHAYVSYGLSTPTDSGGWRAAMESCRVQ